LDADFPLTTTPAEVLRRSLKDLQRKTDAADAAWGLKTAERWEADLEAGTISFVNAKGWTITAPVQLVGVYMGDGTWLWAWEHKSLPAGWVARDSRLAKAFGEAHGLPAFTTGAQECTEITAWEFTAVACHLGGAQGAYRGATGNGGYWFMTFGQVSIDKGEAG
jgi:hypothetical protein